MADDTDLDRRRRVRSSQLRLCERPARRRAENRSACELVLWVEGRWRCEVWFVEGFGRLRLYRTVRIVFDIPIRDSKDAVDQAVRWLGAVMKRA